MVRDPLTPLTTPPPRRAEGNHKIIFSKSF
jgi:hypothetical protein